MVSSDLQNARDDSRFKVDYSRSISDVYTDVINYVVTTSRKLDIISFCKGRVHPEYLPSWVSDWSPSSIRDSQHSHVGFNAALGKPADVTFESSGKIIRVQGIITGVIQSAAMPLVVNGLKQLSFGSHGFYRLLLTNCDWHELAMAAANREVLSEEVF
jgi:hypothetical protein